MNNYTENTFEIHGDEYNATSVPVPIGLVQSWYLSHQLLNYCLQMAVTLCGLITNGLNLMVFSTAGLSDSVTVAFFALSVSDLLHLASFLAVRLLSVLQYELGIHSSQIRLQDVAGFLGWVSVYFMDVSMFVTVFTTFQKCCCVAFPLAFKNVFTKKRSDTAMVLIFFATFVIFLPVFFNIFNKWFFDESTRDVPLDWVSLNTSPEATVWRWMHRIVFTICSQVIVIISLVVITAKLKQSVKFRQSKKADNDYTKKDNPKGDVAFGVKEFRAIQAVQLIAFIFIVATLPASVNSLATMLYPAMKQPRHRTTLYTLVSLVYFGGTINASVNILVYLRYNRRYRQVFMNIFGEKLCVGLREREKNKQQSASVGGAW